jgi:hypothetical protein
MAPRGCRESQGRSLTGGQHELSQERGRGAIVQRLIGHEPPGGKSSLIRGLRAVAGVASPIAP